MAPTPWTAPPPAHTWIAHLPVPRLTARLPAPALLVAAPALLAATFATFAAAARAEAGSRAAPNDPAQAARHNPGAARHNPASNRAHAAHTSRVTDHAKLHLVSSDGNTLIERGRATGTLPGTVDVSLTLHTTTATSAFTIHTKGGTIGGSARGRLKVGKHGWDSFGGKLRVRRGTGRFAHASGSGGLYGTVYRVTDAMQVTVTGTLRYRG